MEEYNRIGFYPGPQRSMSGLETDTIGGFNSMIASEKGSGRGAGLHRTL